MSDIIVKSGRLNDSRVGWNDEIQGDGIFRVTCSVTSKEDYCQLQSTEIQKRQLDVVSRVSFFFSNSKRVKLIFP